MNRQNILIKVGLLLAGILVVSGCMNPFTQNDEENSSSVGSVTISFGDLSASTILPSVSDQIETYEVSLTETVETSGTETVTVTRSATDVADNSGSIAVTNLIVGTWDVTVDGKNGSGEVVATGSDTGISVTDGGTATVSITLAPAMTSATGDGNIEVIVDWSASSISAIDDGEATLNGSDVSGSLTIDTTNRTATFSDLNRESGEYTLAIKLLDTSADPDLLYAVVVEAVHVYDNLTSSKTITLTDAELSTPPTAPTGFTATPNSFSGSDTMELAWTDAAKTETSYEIERSSDGGTSWSSIASLEAGAVSYRDRDGGPGLTADATYDYRIRAVNAFGSSAWVSDATATTPLTYIFVSFTGDDANSGSAFSPVATLDKAWTLTDPNVSNQEIRLEGTTGVVDTFDRGTNNYMRYWQGDTDMRGGYQYSGGEWTHSPGTHTTVIEETSGTDDTTFALTGAGDNSPVSISDVTIRDLSTNTGAVLRLNGVADFTMNNVILEAQGADYASAIKVDDTGSTATTVTVTNSTLRVLDGSLSTSQGNWHQANNVGVYVRLAPAGSVSLTDSDIEVGAGEASMGVYIREGDFSMSGGSISFTADAGEASKGIYGYTNGLSHGASLNVDGVSISTANTTASTSGTATAAIDLSLIDDVAIGALEIRNSTLTPGTTTGVGRAYGLVIGNNVTAESIAIEGNTINMSSDPASTDGWIAGMLVQSVRSATTKETVIEGNTIAFDATVDETAGLSDEAIGLWLEQTSAGEALDLRVANNLIYREDGSTAKFTGIRVWEASSVASEAPFIGNNTIVSLDSGNSSSFTGIQLYSGASPEILNNIIAAGAETASSGISASDLTSAPSRLENNYIEADTLLVLDSGTDVTTIADLDTKTLSTQDGNGTAANNVGEGSGDTLGSAPTLGFVSTTNPYDFSLTPSSDTSLQSGGKDLSAASLSSTTIDTTFTDILGFARQFKITNSGDWSIGAYEY